MCGIVAYMGERSAKPVIIKGLQRLEYRGYDSAGIALIGAEGNIKVEKVAGKVADLQAKLDQRDFSGNIAIGHTRWATHGLPNTINAHPHLSRNGDIAIIHNGIIENHDVLRQALVKRGYNFTSETDSEVLVHLIDEIQTTTNCSLEEAVRLSLHEVVGAYAIVILSTREPNTLIAARKGSPLVIGIGNEEFLCASDATPIVEYTKNVVYLRDDEVAIMKDSSLTIKSIENVEQEHIVHELDLNIEELEKGGYEHFMKKEIFEQPGTIGDCFRGRLRIADTHVQLGGLTRFESAFEEIERIIFVACGTSWHSAILGEYLIEELVRIPVEVEYASEFRYRNPVIKPNDVVIGISQSGETADTLAALQLAKEKGATIWGICNVVGSSIPRMTDAGVYTHVGSEIGVASTKAFTGQVTVLLMLALKMARKLEKIDDAQFRKLLTALGQIPEQVEQILQKAEEVEKIARVYADANNFLYLGRGVQFPIALEGALKLKEISYIHAEGYPAAEMKHGPIALIDEKMPVVIIATNAENYDKVLNNAQEIKARKGNIIAVVSEGDTNLSRIADHVIEVPRTSELLSPLLSIIPLQLLAYYIATMRGCDVDQPRNLAKSVTVE